MILLTIALILFYILKNIYISLEKYIQYTYIFSKQVDISRRLLSTYLFSPYTFHLEINSAELARNLTNEIAVMFHSFILPGLTLFSEVMVLLIISLMLVIVEPIGTLIAFFVIGAAGLLFYTINHSKINKLGKIRQDEYEKMLQWSNQVLGAVKEIKILGRESFFINLFENHCEKYAQSSQVKATISSLPRLFLESVTVITLLAVVLSLLYQGKDISSLLPTLSLFAFSAFRLMPSINRIVSSLTHMRYSYHSVDVIHMDSRNYVARKMTSLKIRPSAEKIN